MTATLVVGDALMSQLTQLAAAPVERGGVLVGQCVQHANSIRFIGTEFIAVSETEYVHQSTYEMRVTSGGFVPALQRAAALGACALWVHNHPGEEGLPVPSAHDERVDRQLADTFRIRTDAPFYGTLIVSPRHHDQIAFTGALLPEAAAPIRFTRMWCVGDGLRLINAFSEQEPSFDAQFDRNVRAFGPDIQRALGSLRVGVVGCGGTGSAVAEQLARLGVRYFRLFDADTLSLSNTTRLYGSSPSLVGALKVDVVASNIQRISPGAECFKVAARITSPEAIAALSDSDVVFGCTDDNAGRLVLSRFSSYLMCPLIDCGVLISSTADGTLIGIDGRITVQTPGSACLLCRSRIDVARAGAEMMPKAERERLEREGYAPTLGAVEPAVVTFTTMVAAAAVNELLERLIDFGPSPRPSEILIRFHDREISTNHALPRPAHYCHQAAGKLGKGLHEPFLDLAWPT
jgi:molybdopterin/thiamine biosynthesis adenylyltransferase